MQKFIFEDTELRKQNHRGSFKKFLCGLQTVALKMNMNLKLFIVQKNINMNMKTNQKMLKLKQTWLKHILIA